MLQKIEFTPPSINHCGSKVLMKFNCLQNTWGLAGLIKWSRDGFIGAKKFVVSTVSI